MNTLEESFIRNIDATETGLPKYLGDDGNVYTQDDIDAEMMPTTDPSVTDEAVVEGIMGVQDPMQEQAETALAEGIEEQKELELVRIGGATLGLPISAALAGADLVSLPILLSQGVITAEEGKVAENILKQFENMPSAYVGAQLKDAVAGMGFSQETVDAFGEGYLAGELLAITSSALPGLKLAFKGASKIGEGIKNYAAGAEGRIAERGTRLMSGLDPQAALDEAIVGTQKLLGAETQPVQNIVSSRLPTAKAATENPLQTRLQVGIESSKADPKAFSKNAQVIAQYPNVRYQGDNPDEAANDLITHVKDNLLYLYDSVPGQTRQRSKQWYVGARKIVDDLSTEYELPDQAVAGVMAVLSPQKDWFMNVSLGKRVVDIHTTKANEPWTDDMMATATRIFGQEKYAPILNGIAGKTYDQLETPGEKAMWLRIYDETYNPREHNVISPEGETQGVRLSGKGEAFKTGWGSLSEIGKAVDILMNPDLANVSSRLGDQHKVRSFYNNMYAPMDEAGDVTIDTHAVAAGLLKPLSGKSTEVTHNFGGTGIANSSVTGSKGTYGLYAEAYRQAAKERGVLPREMQSITWEAVRGLFPAGYKSQAANVEYVDNIWRQYKSGDISLEEARDAVIKHAGGIEAPEWERSGGAAPAEVQDASNAGELLGAGSSEKKPGRSGRGRNSGNSGTDKAKQQ